MLEENRLELEVRKAVYNFVSRHPGLHLNELSRRLNIPVSAINYHLNYLKKIGIIVGRTEGRYIRYYVARKITEMDKKIINLLSQDVPFRIVMFLLLYPNSSQIKISKYLRRHPTTVSFHLDKLIDNDIVEFYPYGSEINYRIKNETNLFELFYEYRDSFLDATLGSIEYSLKFS